VGGWEQFQKQKRRNWVGGQGKNPKQIEIKGKKTRKGVRKK
jgi:hypothetical protein